MKYSKSSSLSKQYCTADSSIDSVASEDSHPRTGCLVMAASPGEEKETKTTTTSSKDWKAAKYYTIGFGFKEGFFCLFQNILSANLIQVTDFCNIITSYLLGLLLGNLLIQSMARVGGLKKLPCLICLLQWSPNCGRGAGCRPFLAF